MKVGDKVICIKNNNNDFDLILFEKVYIVEEMVIDTIKVKYNGRLVLKNRFKTIYELRNDKINKLKKY